MGTNLVQLALIMCIQIWITVSIKNNYPYTVTLQSMRVQAASILMTVVDVKNGWDVFIQDQILLVLHPLINEYWGYLAGEFVV